MPKIQIDKLIRSRRRSVALVITKLATLEVRAPHRTSLKFIYDFIEKKESWILRKLEFMRQNVAQNMPKKFIDGEEFLYLGQTYCLQINDCRKITCTDFLCFPNHLLPAAKKYLMLWYKKQALLTIAERVAWYANQTGLQYQTIKITNAKTRWGSCSARGGLNFSWYLIMAPLHIIDYVVVHELAHLIERNHSKRFWDQVKTIMPDYETKRRWLKQNGHALCF